MSGVAGAALNGFRELWAHRTRSLLSMSGIILGVAALSTMLGVGEGMLGGFRDFVSAQGGVERIAVVRSSPPPGREALGETSPGLVVRDAVAIANAVPSAARISAEIVSGEILASRGGREIAVKISGCTPDWLSANRRTVVAGRFVGDIDRQTRANVCVIGEDIREALFRSNESPLGGSVRLDGKKFTVIGILDRFEAGAGSSRLGETARWKNLTACIPLRTMTTRFTGDDRLTGLVVRARRAEEVPVVAEQLDNVLIQTHRGLRDFRIETNEATLAAFRKTERGFMWSFAGVTAVALLVGGAGIMNVMLASIQERTREIGIRLALGARPADIFLQFLIESSVVGAVGGILGLAGSWAMLTAFAKTIAAALPDAHPPALSDDVMLAGVLFSGALGLAAGIWPALRAARMNPIDALRAE